MINVNQLKKQILDLAFSGKLTEHNNKESSDELISKLFTNKQKKYTTFSTELTGYEIPSNWNWCMTYQAVSLDNGEESSGESLPYLEVKFLRTGKEPKLLTSGVIVEKGEKLILVDGENSGEVFLANERGYKGSTLKILNISNAFIDKYIFLFIYSCKEGFRKNKTGAAIPHLDKKMLFETPLPIPPLEEQNRIVEKLDEIFAELDMIDEKQIKFQSIQDKMESKILKLAIQGKLVEQRPEEGTAKDMLKAIGKTIDYDHNEDLPFDIPESWIWCKLSDIGTTNIGLTYHPQDVVENGTMVIRSSNIVNGQMNYSDKVCVSCLIKENQYVKNNDIVICSRNGSKHLVGKNAIYKGDSNKYAFGAFMAIFRTNFYDYVHLYFNSDAFKRYFSSDDSKQINQVTQAILKDSLIPLPPYEEQKRIVEKYYELVSSVKSL